MQRPRGRKRGGGRPRRRQPSLLSPLFSLSLSLSLSLPLSLSLFCIWGLQRGCEDCPHSRRKAPANPFSFMSLLSAFRAKPVGANRGCHSNAFPHPPFFFHFGRLITLSYFGQLIVMARSGFPGTAGNWEGYIWSHMSSHCCCIFNFIKTLFKEIYPAFVQLRRIYYFPTRNYYSAMRGLSCEQNPSSFINCDSCVFALGRQVLSPRSRTRPCLTITTSSTAGSPMLSMASGARRWRRLFTVP